MAEVEWPDLTEARRLRYVRTVRSREAGPAATTEVRSFKPGDLVPQVLWGRNKGAEVILAERGLLPPVG